MRLLIYAMGGGLGHLNRSLGLARKAIQCGHQVHILANSHLTAHVDWAYAAQFGHLQTRDVSANLTITDLSNETSSDTVCDQHEQTKQRVRQIVSAQEYDTLVVDAFPRGLAGELADLLPELSCKKVLVHRDLNPAYVQSFDLAQFANVYDQILIAGEPAPLSNHTLAVRTEPWLACDTDELADRDQVRRQFGVDIACEMPIVAVVVAGRETEQQELASLADALSRELADHAHVRILTLDPRLAARYTDISIQSWPALRWLSGVDLVVGSAGYNTVHECRLTSTPLLAFARNRMYDQQAQRLQPPQLIVQGDNLLQKISAALATQSPQSRMDYVNGTTLAIECIERL